MDFLRCLQELFEELHAVFEPLCPQSDASVEGTWSYTGKQVLPVTLHFLAHCPTARCFSRRSGFPPSSIMHIILRRAAKRCTSCC